MGVHRCGSQVRRREGSLGAAWLKNVRVARVEANPLHGGASELSNALV